MGVLRGKAADAEHAPDVAREAERVEHGQEVEERLVGRVMRPALNRDAVGCRVYARERVREREVGERWAPSLML